MKTIKIFVLGIVLVLFSQYSWQRINIKEIYLISCILYFIAGFFIKNRKEFLLIISPIFLMHIFALSVNQKLFPVLVPGLLIVVLLSIFGASFVQKKKLLFAFAILLFIPLCIFLIAPNIQLNQRIEKPNKNLILENASFINSNDEGFNFKELENKIVIIDLWYNSCGSCYRLFSELEILKREIEKPKYKDRVVLLSINDGINDSYEDFMKNRRIEKYSLDFYYSKATFFNNDITIQGYPVLLIFDIDKNLKYQINGFYKGEENFYHKRVLKYINNM